MNAQRHLVADDVAQRIALLGLRRTGKQRGRRAGTLQQRYFDRHRLLPCQQPMPASGASGSGAFRPWPAVAAPTGSEDDQLIRESYQPAGAVPLTNCRSAEQWSTRIPTIITDRSHCRPANR